MAPYFTVPNVMKQAVIDATNDNQNHYISPQGDHDLLEALAHDFNKNFNLPYQTDELCIVPGPKPALYTAMAVVLDPNAHRNRVLIWSPAYESFRDLAFFITHQPSIILDTDDNWYTSSLRS